MGGPSNTRLTRDVLRRLLVSLISAEQTARIKSGAISPDVSIERKLLETDAAGIDALAVEEGDLGFDSLSRLELILRVNRFFGLHSSGVDDYLLVQRRIGDWISLLEKHFEIREGSVDFTFATSGSTGSPKQVTHSIETLDQEINAFVDGPLVHLGDESRILALVPPHHIYGFLFTCLLPSRAGLEAVDLTHRSPGSVFRQAQGGDLVVATPHLWSRLADFGERFAPGVRGTTSGGPSTPATWAIRERSNLLQLIEVFGSTETAGVGYRTEPEAPFTLLTHLKRSGSEVQRLRNRTPLDLQDRLNWTADREFEVDGRLDDVIQIAGVNVSPAHVEVTLRSIPGVAEVAVRAGETGLRAYVVPKTGERGNPSWEELFRKEMRTRLDPVARPTSLAFGEALPRSAMGKLADWV